MNDNTPETPSAPELAAIDLGSNSFHMLIARVDQGELRPIEKLGEKVQLAAGMTDGNLSEAAIARGLDCLTRFAQRLRDFSDSTVRVVGTNALRAAKNRQLFIEPAERLLGCPIEVIAGREEARLVYLGVAHTLADDDESRLVVDIGGGSTEFVIGTRFEGRVMESLHMGCVTYQRYFVGGEITPEYFQRAYSAAYRELLNIQRQFLGKWKNCVGSSGTLLAIEQVLIQQGLSEAGIQRHSLRVLREQLLAFDHFDEMTFAGLKENRRQLIASGLAITMALFDALDIDVMLLSDGALREGVLFDLQGRLNHEDVRERTIGALEQRYDVNIEQGARVEAFAEAARQQLASQWGLGSDKDSQLLGWAARLHEVGLAISHSQFHKHGGYIIRHADLAGFSRLEQEELALLVRLHRRRFVSELLDDMAKEKKQRLLRLAILLRLAVVLKHMMALEGVINFTVKAKDKNELTVDFAEGWLEQHPLTAADLERERKYLEALSIQLHVT